MLNDIGKKLDNHEKAIADLQPKQNIQKGVWSLGLTDDEDETNGDPEKDASELLSTLNPPESKGISFD